jgi:hypothetical protein
MKKIIFILPFFLLISCQSILRTFSGVKKMTPKTTREIQVFAQEKNIPNEDILLLKIEMKDFFAINQGKQNLSSDLDYQLYDRAGVPIAEYFEGCVPVNLEYGKIDKMKLQEDKRYAHLSKIFEKVQSFDKKMFDFEEISKENDFVLIVDWSTWAYKITKQNIKDTQKFIKNNPQYKIKVFYLNLDLIKNGQ